MIDIFFYNNYQFCNLIKLQIRNNVFIFPFLENIFFDFIYMFVCKLPYTVSLIFKLNN